MSKIIYLTSWYNDPNPDRADELLRCMEYLVTAIPKGVYLCVDNEGECDLLPNHVKNKVTVLVTVKRPSYNDFFKLANQLSDPGDIVIIANTDIFPISNIEEQLNLLKENECFALSRWDINATNAVRLYNHCDSQDVWIFRAPIKPIDGNFYLGKPGCDNRIAYEIKKSGYEIRNPAQDVKFAHLHLSGIRNYTRAETVPPPYLQVHTCKL